MAREQIIGYCVRQRQHLPRDRHRGAELLSLVGNEPSLRRQFVEPEPKHIVEPRVEGVDLAIWKIYGASDYSSTDKWGKSRGRSLIRRQPVP